MRSNLATVSLCLIGNFSAGMMWDDGSGMGRVARLNDSGSDEQHARMP
jgi:hypothetical protein